MKGTNLRPITKKEAHLVKKYLPDVQKYVNIVRRRHEIPNHIPPDDLYSAGIWGLLLAVKRVKDVDERCIRRYIYLRVRGAVLDELRSLDILPHSARTSCKRVQAFCDVYIDKHGCQPDEKTIKKHFHLTKLQWQNLKQLLSFRGLYSMHEQGGGAGDYFEPVDKSIATPDLQCEYNDFYAELKRQLDALPLQEKNVINSYYFGRRTLSEIGQKYGITGSRAHQVLHRGLQRLRTNLHIEGVTIRRIHSDR